MRTTLKRGFGRAAAVNGNGAARVVLPPPAAAPITRYEQPVSRRRTGLVTIAFTVGLLYGTALVALLAQATGAGNVRSSPQLKIAVAAGGALVVVTALVLLVAWARSRSGFWTSAATVVGCLFLGALLVGAGSGGGTYLYYHESIVGGLTAHSKDVIVASKKLDIPLPNQPAIALVVGYDKRKGIEADITGSRSDTIMLLRADPVTNSISMLSFPRDLQAELWCDGKIVGTDRINAAYGACGSNGPLGTLETVKHLTGLPINYLITVDFHGFKQIVDRVGGVWIDVDRRYYNKNTGTSYSNFADINLWPGYQKLNGARALEYVRFRHTDSDIVRIARQQQFDKGMKLQVSQNFSIRKALKVVGAITHSVEIGQTAGGSLEKALRSYALFAYGLPAGHFIQTKIDGLEGENVLYAPPAAIASAVQEFQNPDVQAAQKATAVSFGRKAAGLKAPAPSHVTISVVNGNGIPGSASTAASGLNARGYQIITPQSTALQNAPTFDYFHTKVYFDRTQTQARPAAQKVAELFGDGEVEPLPPPFFARANGAMLTVVVGSTFHGALAPAPVDKTPIKEPPAVRTDPGQTQSLLKGVQRRAGFQLMVPTVLESSSRIDTEVPLRLYYLKKHEKAVRLTFLSGTASGYWGIEETTWKDAPVLQQPNFKHVIKGREYGFYYSGPHLHMVVLHVGDASYWVINDLLDNLSNETMIAIAKGLKPLR
jgi:LCP family protein required for cell wall assembly